MARKLGLQSSKQPQVEPSVAVFAEVGDRTFTPQR
jgi:hypothetical protein